MSKQDTIARTVPVPNSNPAWVKLGEANDGEWDD